MRICKRGLNYIQIYNGNGDVRICSWLKRGCDGRDGGYIGNLLENSFYDIYHGDRANEIRKKMICGDYSICSQGGNCPYIANHTLDQNSVDIDSVPEYPSELWLAFEGKCNYNCTVCSAHNNMKAQSVGDWNEKYDIIENRIREILPYIRRISANGRAELFCGERTMRLLSEWNPIAPANECSVLLETNGSLFDEIQWKKIENLGKYKLDVNITVMSFDEPTYQYLSGTKLPISKIENNLRFIKSLREKNVINYLEIATVVQERNFRELPSFCNRCIHEFGADMVRLRPVILGGPADKNIDWFADVRNPYHPYYKEFLNIWNSPLLDDPKIYKWSGDVMSSTGPHPGIKADRTLHLLDKVLCTADLDDRINALCDRDDSKVISLYGIGRVGKMLIKLLNDRIRWGEFYDGNYSNYLYEGKHVISPKEGMIRGNNNCIIITPIFDTDSIITKLRELGYKGEIITLESLLSD